MERGHGGDDSVVATSVSFVVVGVVGVVGVGGHVAFTIWQQTDRPAFGGPVGTVHPQIADLCLAPPFICLSLAVGVSFVAESFLGVVVAVAVCENYAPDDENATRCQALAAPMTGVLEHSLARCCLGLRSSPDRPFLV